MDKTELFIRLTADREDSSKTFAKPSMSGFNRLLSDMYAERAHYIYELIQNADDARATQIKFILKKSELYFLHNGNEKFTLSDPDSEEVDTENKKLGHINAITSVGNTTKNEQKIGKFGIGFKSVFQYTDSPIIQDDNFSFQIKKLFVPYLFENRFNHRAKGETLFVIPFNKDEQIAFEDSKNKFDKFDETILLFLNNIQQIHFQYQGKDKVIKKKIIKESTHSKSETGFNKIKSYVIKIESNKYLLFSAYITEKDSESLHKIAVAYPLNKQNNIDSNREYNAYCFFPTQEKTGFKFILHAPFLLTDNRQNIKKDLEWNEDLINDLADLIYDSFLLLKKLKYLNNKFFYSLPLDTDKYKNQIFYNRELFQQVYVKIKEVLTNHELIPTGSEKFIRSKDSHLIRGKELVGLLEDNILSDLKRKENAAVVFPEITETGKTAKLWAFLKDTLEIEVIEPREFIKWIDKNFISKRSDNWLKKFYKYCLSIPFLSDELKIKDIIRLENGENVKPFKSGVAQVFLKEVDPEYPHIKKVFLADDNSIKFFKSIGIGFPDKKDVIFRTIIRRYDHEEFSVDDDILLKDFDNILSYYCECNDDTRSELIKQLNNKCFIVARTSDAEESSLFLPNSVYLKNELLNKYFDNYSEYIFFDDSYYSTIISKYDKEKVNRFLSALGLASIPRIIFNKSQTLRDVGINNYSYRYNPSINDYLLDGFENFMQNLSLEKSIILWNYLRELASKGNLQNYKNGTAQYFYRNWKTHAFVTTLFEKLTNSAWLYTKKGELGCSKELFINELHNEYNLDDATSLIKFLELKDTSDKYSFLSEGEKKSISLIKDLIESGISPDELYSKLPELKDLILNYLTQKTEDKRINNESTRKRLSKSISVGKEDVRVEIDPNRTSASIINEKSKLEATEKSESELDDDDLTPQTTVTTEQLESIKKKLENEAEILNRIENLKEGVKNSQQFTLGWFKSLLELEYFDRKDREFRKSSIHVTFNNIQKDPASDRTLILSGTNYLPETIEDNESLSLTLSYKNRKQTILVEAVSRRNKILKAKLRENINIDDLNIDSIERVEIDVKNANFIFENLKQSFACFSEEPFNFTDEYNFKDNLPENLEVIFGPPGTGKTTFIASNTIYPITKSNKFKILVLAPTNKAADVLTNKLIEVCEKNNNKSYLHWLVRFGITNEPSLEGIVFHNNKYITKSQLDKLVLVTTVARFTYDSIMVDDVRENQKYFLKNYDWDYIIFDESSMINLPSTVFPLYYRYTKKSDTKFIFSGDPFQISPIVFVNQVYWKDGNIFSLVELNKKGSFINPKPNPANIKITNLTKQFRSIPQIGSLFSKLTYDDKLEHHRNFSSIKEISIQSLEVKPITIINFKVDEYDSIYRSHKLKGSPYHIYSSLFVVELIDYLLKNIDLKTNKDFSIGIICPYRAQQSIIDKIIGTFKLPSNISLSTGTIHGFQGDECDMIISLFNPPKFVSKSEEIFLNKHNIINVAISRARDYLVLLMPYDPSNRISVNDLFLLEEIKKICYTDQQIKLVCKTFKDSEIEKIIFGKPDFIEQISFPTAHQDVNIYSALDRKYEIRYDENAVDIQIKK